MWTIEVLSTHKHYKPLRFGIQENKAWNMKTYSYVTCDISVTHDEGAVGLLETK